MLATLNPPPVIEEEHSILFLNDCATLITDIWADGVYLGVRRVPLGSIDGIDVDDLPAEVRDEFLRELDLWKDAVSHEWACKAEYNRSRGSF